ncbi:hypothetical protein C8R45DRAFT_924317 [Mycena sanguinolenta]|nr:hypothetical protein C8R45DRAFT_924317 [Mycena sanguinolenta]
MLEYHTQSIHLSRILGQAAEARHLSFVDWCKHSKTHFAPSALWALGASTNADRTGTHLFVIYIDVEERISIVGKTCFKRWVRAAKCASEAEVMQGWKVPPAVPLCARILLIDDGLPNVLDMFNLMAEEVNIVKDSVPTGDQLPIYRYIHRLGSTPAVNEVRYRHTDRWKLSHADQFAMAASSALDIPRHPQRIDMEEQQGVFGKQTIRSAKMLSLAELRPLFHGDTHIMKDKLFPQPNILRTVQYSSFGNRHEQNSQSWDFIPLSLRLAHKTQKNS